MTDTVYSPSTYFPIKVKIRRTFASQDEVKIIFSPRELEVGHTFTLLEINVRCGKQAVRLLAMKAIQNCRHLRYGQAIFNAAYQFRPDVVTCLQSTDQNPFYNDSRVEEFLQSVFGDQE